MACIRVIIDPLIRSPLILTSNRTSKWGFEDIIRSTESIGRLVQCFWNHAAVVVDDQAPKICFFCKKSGDIS